MEYLAELVGVSANQLTFFSTQIVSLPLAVLFRTQLSPTSTSCTTRHTIGAIIGLILLYWCFGWSVLHPIAQTLGVYAILKFLPSHHNYKFAFVYAMGYMLYVQVLRMYAVDSRHVMEISYPMMMITQKLTSLSFGIHDGTKKDRESFGPLQKKYVISQFPSIIEVIGFVFNFGGLICGPSYFFTDYMDFISGANYECNDNVILSNGSSQEKCHSNDSGKIYKNAESDLKKEVLTKLTTSILCLIVHLLLSSRYPPELNGDYHFIESNGFFYRLLYCNISVILSRYRYFFAWRFGEAVQNASGLGLHYVNGNPQWDLTNNVNILQLERSTTIKEYLDNWNICTTRWLRHVSYERAGNHKLILTYVLNSLWHGIEAGYFVAATTLALFTLASRKVRRVIRPHVLETKWKIWYDIFTGIVSQVSLHYVAISFNVLLLRPTLYCYTYSMYWWIHIVALLIIFVPVPRSFMKTKEKSS